MGKTRKNHKGKISKEQTQQAKWRKLRRKALRRNYPMLAKSTIAEYTYSIERIIPELITGQLSIRLPEEGRHKSKKYIITLKGHYKLQKQSRNKTSITVIDIETGEKIEVPFRVLVNSKRRKRGSVDI